MMVRMTATTETEAPDASASEPSTEVKVGHTRGIPQAAIDARLANARYRKAAKAAELLKSLGWTVKPPAEWESPEIAKARADYRNALEKLAAAGVDISTLSLSGADDDEPNDSETADESGEPNDDENDRNMMELEPTPVPEPAEPAKPAPRARAGGRRR